MKQPNHVLIEASARLFADGHPDLAADVRQLAKRWTPQDEQMLCGHASTDHEGIDEQEHF